jgi:hypothetical protein
MLLAVAHDFLSHILHGNPFTVKKSNKSDGCMSDIS